MFEFFFFEDQIILLDLIKNLFRFLLPFNIELFEIINFLNPFNIIFSVLLYLLMENLEIAAALFNLLIMLTICLPIYDFKSLDLFVEFGTFRLITSQSFIGHTYFFLIAF